MTQYQVEFQKLQETKRSNLAKEAYERDKADAQVAKDTSQAALNEVNAQVAALTAENTALKNAYQEIQNELAAYEKAIQDYQYASGGSQWSESVIRQGQKISDIISSLMKSIPITGRFSL